jgi:ankyrin repeat protein
VLSIDMSRPFLVVLVIAASALVGCNSRQRELDRALYQAAASGEMAIAENAIAHGANVNMMSTKQTRHSPLFVAIFHHHDDLAKMLLSKGADPNHHTGTGESMLYMALLTERDNGDLIQALIEAGADVSEEAVVELSSNLPVDHKNRMAFERARSSRKAQNRSSSDIFH